jgi:hypothetical protein
MTKVLPNPDGRSPELNSLDQKEHDPIPGFESMMSMAEFMKPGAWFPIPEEVYDRIRMGGGEKAVSGHGATEG